jgi:hypothetical protein
MNMSESRALVLFFAVFVLVVIAVYCALSIIGASPRVVTACLFMLMSLAAYIAARIVMHYAPPDEQHR